MVQLAEQAAALGFRALGVTGGEPFLIPDMVGTLARLGEILLTVGLTNGTLASDLLLTRTIDPVSVPARGLLQLVEGRPPGSDATLNIP